MNDFAWVYHKRGNRRRLEQTTAQWSLSPRWVAMRRDYSTLAWLRDWIVDRITQRQKKGMDVVNVTWHYPTDARLARSSVLLVGYSSLNYHASSYPRTALRHSYFGALITAPDLSSNRVGRRRRRGYDAPESFWDIITQWFGFAE